MAESAFVVENEKARLVLENFDSPIVAKVAHRNQQRMTVKQALPFLKLDSGVRDEEGRRAFIQSVGVSVEQGTPNLVLDLVYEATIGPSDPSIGHDDTVPITIASRRPRRPDQTIPFGFPKRAGRHDRVTSLERQRRAFIPDEAAGCYHLLTKRKVEPRVVIASEKTLQIHREKTEIMHPHLRERHTTPNAEQLLATSAEKSRPKPSFASRARALAAAFWGHRA